MAHSNTAQKNTKTTTNSPNKFQFSNLLTILITGLVVGIITALGEISLAVLIFSGNLSDFVANGIGLFLVGSLIATLITGFTSSYPGMISANQDLPAAITAVIATSITASISGTLPPDKIYLTIVAAIIVTSLLTGLFFIFQGYFKLGGLSRFLPYPVVGGFLAGMGWLIFLWGLASMTNIPPEIKQLPAYFQADVWLHWVPGAILAVSMVLILNRYNHYLIMPAMLLGTMALFYLIVLLFNIPINQISAEGWLLGPFPKGGLWQPLTPTQFLNVEWSVIFQQSSNIATIAVVCTIALLLNSSGLELSLKQDIHLDKELKVAGFSTLGSGLVGGLVSYPTVSYTILGHKMGSGNRLLSLVVAAVLGTILYFGPNMLALIPKIVLGGLLMYLGLSLLDEWVYKAWFRFSRTEFLVIIIIMIVIATIGFLQGLILGVVLAVVLFVVNYSRTSVVKHALSGQHYQSQVARNQTQRKALQQKSDELYILQLQGFIFFGTANTLLNQVRERMEAVDLPKVRFVVLDFRQVTGLDSTAILSFTKMVYLAQTQQITLVFSTHLLKTGLLTQTSTKAKFFTQLQALEQDKTEKTLHFFSDLDHALEWCEDQILLTAGIDPNDEESLQTQLNSLLVDNTQLKNLITYFERIDIKAGDYLIKQNDPPKDLYFIESGQVTAQLEFPDRNPIRLVTMRSGYVVGEIGFYLNQPRTAAVITDKASIIYRLSAQALKQMEQDAPQAALAFQQGIIRLMSQKLTNLTNTINAMQR